ncbi:hypothetical protein J6590_039259 [Homalodisca vitripennis]|nr:hypothetical protein J6590_039259 [Homalodisca vitripennis]
MRVVELNMPSRVRERGGVGAVMTNDMVTPKQWISLTVHCFSLYSNVNFPPLDKYLRLFGDLPNDRRCTPQRSLPPVVSFHDLSVYRGVDVQWLLYQTAAGIVHSSPDPLLPTVAYLTGRLICDYTMTMTNVRSVCVQRCRCGVAVVTKPPRGLYTAADLRLHYDNDKCQICLCTEVSMCSGCCDQTAAGIVHSS